MNILMKKNKLFTLQNDSTQPYANHLSQYSHRNIKKPTQTRYFTTVFATAHTETFASHVVSAKQHKAFASPLFHTHTHTHTHSWQSRNRKVNTRQTSISVSTARKRDQNHCNLPLTPFSCQFNRSARGNSEQQREAKNKTNLILIYSNCFQCFHTYVHAYKSERPKQTRCPSRDRTRAHLPALPGRSISPPRSVAP